MLAGGFMWHLFRALRRSLGRIMLWFLVTGLIAAVIVELVGIYESGGQLPTTLTHITAAVLGVAVGYAMSATMLIAEIIRDLFITIEDIEHDVRNEFAAGSRLVDDLIEGGSTHLLGGVVHRTFDRK